MAGTAEGAAKARAARRQPTIPGLDDAWPPSTGVQPVDAVQQSGMATLSGNQTVAANVVSMATLPASIFLAKLIRNGKASMSLRFSAACKIMEFAGFGQQPAGQSAADDSQAAVIAKLAAALGRPVPRQPVTIEAERTEPVDKP